jgi:hypothetical protein
MNMTASILTFGCSDVAVEWQDHEHELATDLSDQQASELFGINATAFVAFDDYQKVAWMSRFLGEIFKICLVKVRTKVVQFLSSIKAFFAI